MQLITLKSAFDEFDVDGSSYISADEMGQALTRLGLQPTPQEIQVRVWLRMAGSLRAAFPRHSPVTEALPPLPAARARCARPALSRCRT